MARVNGGSTYLYLKKLKTTVLIWCLSQSQHTPYGRLVLIAKNKDETRPSTFSLKTKNSLFYHYSWLQAEIRIGQIYDWKRGKQKELAKCISKWIKVYKIKNNEYRATISNARLVCIYRLKKYSIERITGIFETGR